MDFHCHVRLPERVYSMVCPDLCLYIYICKIDLHLTLCSGPPKKSQCLVGQPIGDFLEPWDVSIKQW